MRPFNFFLPMTAKTLLKSARPPVSRSQPTRYVKRGLLAEASVGDVSGDTAKHSSVRLLQARHLEDPHGEKRVPGRQEQCGGKNPKM